MPKSLNKISFLSLASVPLSLSSASLFDFPPFKIKVQKVVLNKLLIWQSACLQLRVVYICSSCRLMNEWFISSWEESNCCQSLANWKKWHLPYFLNYYPPLNSFPFLKKTYYIKKGHYLNFCNFEIASLMSPDTNSGNNVFSQNDNYVFSLKMKTFDLFQWK